MDQKLVLKVFGFIPSKNKNIRTPHIGKVILEEGVEIGANSTIDRGSLSDTIIGKNTFLDNQVHVAHNVKIGKNCYDSRSSRLRRKLNSR